MSQRVGGVRDGPGSPGAYSRAGPEVIGGVAVELSYIGSVVVVGGIPGGIAGGVTMFGTITEFGAPFGFDTGTLGVGGAFVPGGDVKSGPSCGGGTVPALPKFGSVPGPFGPGPPAVGGIVIGPALRAGFANGAGPESPGAKPCGGTGSEPGVPGGTEPNGTIAPGGAGYCGPYAASGGRAMPGGAALSGGVFGASWSTLPMVDHEQDRAAPHRLGDRIDARLQSRRQDLLGARTRDVLELRVGQVDDLDDVVPLHDLLEVSAVKLSTGTELRARNASVFSDCSGRLPWSDRLRGPGGLRCC